MEDIIVKAQRKELEIESDFEIVLKVFAQMWFSNIHSHWPNQVTWPMGWRRILLKEAGAAGQTATCKHM